ncbi:hypothetical protein [Pseudomonas monteilii]|nr:hypothetical protein [Pseudomonas monteilii]
MQTVLTYFVRPAKRKSDIFFLILAALVGGAAAVLMTMKISLLVGIPFFFFTTLVLHFAWRSPEQGDADIG